MTSVIPCSFFAAVLFLFSIGPISAQDWWSIADTEFVTRFGNLAKGTQIEQSRFAWMLFLRANQQVTFSGDQKKYSQWELWPSDLDTFSPNAPPFVAANKIRRVPHLEVSQLLLALPRLKLPVPSPRPGGEEITRNLISYDYIAGRGLNSRNGIAKYLGTPGAKVDFPSGAIETKAAWIPGSLAGAYQDAGYSLEALHLMVKVAPAPNDPFKDNTPSWFWTTFELKDNQSLAAAQKFETYNDVLPAAEIASLLTQAGLADTPFINYVSDGHQIQFFDAKNKVIRLGNSKIEGFLGRPPGDPTSWEDWPTSCHSCHGQSSVQLVGNSVTFLPFTTPVGPLTGRDLPGAGFQSLDFLWAFTKAK